MKVTSTFAVAQGPLSRMVQAAQYLQMIKSLKMHLIQSAAIHGPGFLCHYMDDAIESCV